MTQCIFCETVLTPSTKPEHILLNALGGRKTTRSAICSDHNNDFGATIDKAITAQVASFRNLLQLDSGTGKPPPGLQTQNMDGERLVIRPDGVPELVQKPFVATRRADGAGFDIKINVKDEEELARIVPHIAAAIDEPVESVWRQLAAAGGQRMCRRAGTVRQQLSLGGEDSLRSISKAALCLLATVIGTASLRGAAFAEARTFVVDGGEVFNRERGSLDSRRLPAADVLEARFGPLFNLIYVRSDSRGRVVAHYTLYNLVAWQVVLAEAGGPANLNIALVSNPLNPADWADDLADELDVPFEWLDTPQRDDVLEAARARVAGALAVWQERGTGQLVDHIVRKVMTRHGIFGEDEVIGTEALLTAVTNEIAEELSHHVVGVPFSRPFTTDDVRRAQALEPKPRKNDR
ncbi:HNH endonuclease [uncultured Brevundimonas sp.]|uniref:HNH endonuclease n=1 Tax=uncultured Brevundimonas sp. TaxID=213418 RepID=UPI0025E0D0AF|nr:HNH endonuclease [uncultured Brevundimonas sp.]